MAGRKKVLLKVNCHPLPHPVTLSPSPCHQWKLHISPRYWPILLLWLVQRPVTLTLAKLLLLLSTTWLVFSLLTELSTEPNTAPRCRNF